MTKSVLTESVRLIGPAALVLSAARAVAAKRDRLMLLFDGDPGIGKTSLANQHALEIADGVRAAIDTVNGQSLSIDMVRDWSRSACYGNLFAAWTVKRIDEIDQASSAAQSEMLTYLDHLPARHAVIVTTNDFAKLRASSKGRLESRFVRFPVGAPSIPETASYLVKRHGIPPDKARAIARGAVPDGVLDGCNVRTALHDAEAFAALRHVLTRS